MAENQLELSLSEDELKRGQVAVLERHLQDLTITRSMLNDEVE